MTSTTHQRPRIVQGTVKRGPVWLLPSVCVLGGAVLGATFMWLTHTTEVPVERVSQTELVRMADDSAQLSQEIAVAERARQVSENAMAALKLNIFEMDQQLASQREEVSFYRRLLDAGGSVRGLAVHEFQLTPTTSPRVFGYRVVLTQNLKKTRRVDGTVALSVNGIADDKAATLDATKLGVSPPLQPFEFKYYQQLEGTLSLPEGFTPREVVVRAQVDDSNRSAQEAFPWSGELSADPSTNAGIIQP